MSKGERALTIHEAAWQRIREARLDLDFSLCESEARGIRNPCKRKITLLMRDLNWIPQPSHFTEGISSTTANLKWKFVEDNLSLNGLEAFVEFVAGKPTITHKIDDSLDIDALIALQPEPKPAPAQWGTW